MVEMNARRQDFEQLQRFSRAGEQSAFANVVRRHLDLVFATALRKLEDPGAAQEVSQNVFAALGRKAWQFAPDDSLPAWLHKTTLFQSSTNLANWQPIWTRTLSTLSTNFVDPDWVNHPHRFYRAQSY